ncbi:MAG: TetR/AcrR family transcriptional regulator [Coriobacteriales bacterium]
MVNKQPEVTEATRRAFVEAYCQLQMKNPGTTVTVRALTEKAGYNRTTFYRYFPDTLAVMEWMEDDVVATVLKDIEKRSPETALADEFSAAFARLNETHRMQLGVLFSPANRSRFTEKLKQAVAPIYAESLGADLGNPRARALLDMFFSAIFSQVAKWFDGSNTLSPDEVLKLNRSLLEMWLMPQLRNSSEK